MDVAYYAGWGLLVYLLLRALGLLAPARLRERVAVWAIYAASLTTITKLLGF
ncbi:hypothetical protein ACWCYZ_16740 [Streptomyces virginiae]|uniref:hypothetical protein n=1 Tax=Streptomyces virginiae TaxID=1961 RepID=UPI00365D84CA